MKACGSEACHEVSVANHLLGRIFLGLNVERSFSTSATSTASAAAPSPPALASAARSGAASALECSPVPLACK